MAPAFLALLRARLGPASVRSVAALECFDSIDSTNAHLLAAAVPPAGQASVCVAAHQTAGRGRRGRTWLTPPGSGVCLSFGWTFPVARCDLSALTLAVGVVVRRALQSLGTIDIGLKWPNDLVVNGGKLGGILAEVRLIAEAAYVVIGIGVNLDLPADFAAAVAAQGGQPPQDLRQAGLSDVNAVSVAAVLIDQLCLALPVYAAHGFEPFSREWTEADILRDRCVEWVTGETRREGIARGIASDGTLLVEYAGGMERLIAGEVTLRRAA